MIQESSINLLVSPLLFVGQSTERNVFFLDDFILTIMVRLIALQNMINGTRNGAETEHSKRQDRRHHVLAEVQARGSVPDIQRSRAEDGISVTHKRRPYKKR
jgi:hypothetical protein